MLLILPKITFELIVILSILITFYFISDPVELIPMLSIFMLSLMRIMPAITSTTKCFQTIQSVLPIINSLQTHFDESGKLETVISRDIKFNEKIEIKNATFSFDKKIKIFEDANLIINKN